MVLSLLFLHNTAMAEDIAKYHPALALMNRYAAEIKNDKLIIPYMVNIIAIYELENKRHDQDVKKYIVWYLDHLNYPDRQGLTGTIYNYEITADGQEISTLQYDSVDGYAGTFLYLLNIYFLRTGDQSLINQYWDKIRTVAYLIPYLQKRDGLIVAVPQNQDNTKYLMDNCEAYAGMISFYQLAEKIGIKEDSYYAGAAQSIRKSILKNMYDGKKKNFFWAIDDRGKHPSDWSVLYPDALAQIFPIYYGLLDMDVKKKKMLFRKFNGTHGNNTERFPLEQRMIYELTLEKMRRSI